MTLTRIEDAARKQALTLRGIAHPVPDPVLPEACQTLILLGPDEPDFWPVFYASPENQDGGPDPMNRWSKRVIDVLAQDWGGTAIYPSDGPPYPAFIQWALESGQSHIAPVGMLVHNQAGLFVSFRGAVALPYLINAPLSAPSPCDSCAEKPCLTACPVGALGLEQDYDVPRCRTHVRGAEGKACLNGGCLVRCICPVSNGFGRLPAQSAFHMAAFLGN